VGYSFIYRGLSIPTYPLLYTTFNGFGQRYGRHLADVFLLLLTKIVPSCRVIIQLLPVFIVVGDSVVEGDKFLLHSGNGAFFVNLRFNDPASSVQFAP
jgi:hypothetical protein